MANNVNLKMYSEAVAEVARQNDVPFVDLFTASLGLYARATQPLTSDGVHLNELGHRLISEAILKSLWPGQTTSLADSARSKRFAPRL
jgi:lysophospholipase L1-like esterase